jgi:hypothetical protein
MLRSEQVASQLLHGSGGKWNQRSPLAVCIRTDADGFGSQMPIRDRPTDACFRVGVGAAMRPRTKSTFGG